jgi:Protein of unknown function with PCYCGC motif
VVDRLRERRRHRARTSGVSRRNVWLVAGVVGLAVAAGAVFWWPGGGSTHAYTLAPESALPAYFRKAPPNVRDAYRFAIANRGILQQIPCYCGCGSDGHKNNADCYIKDVKPDGTVDFDKMSFG